VRVILTAGVLEVFDEERARQVAADATLKKPFEASALVSAVKPLRKRRPGIAPRQPEAALRPLLLRKQSPKYPS